MNIDKLEEIARAVTEPTAWSVVKQGGGADVRAKYAAGGSVWIAECGKEENAAHIAAFSPPTALAMLAVCKAALSWWEHMRPHGWTEAEHLKNPLINRHVSEADKEMARAVAAIKALEEL